MTLFAHLSPCALLLAAATDTGLRGDEISMAVARVNLSGRGARPLMASMIEVKHAKKLVQELRKNLVQEFHFFSSCTKNLVQEEPRARIPFSLTHQASSKSFCCDLPSTQEPTAAVCTCFCELSALMRRKY
jgi:hypothetical protein